jgi:hypothetical protein
MKIRLMFEPHPEVNCNVNEMFRCYGENYLSDFPEFEWAGFGIMNASDTKYGGGEPFYQFLATDCTDVLLKNIQDYVKINPMHGYYTHIFIGEEGKNEEKIK